ncbi:MAG: HlyD family efflux transporter periplasmic adaptor subunit [Bacteroidota bacterium]
MQKIKTSVLFLLLFAACHHANTIHPIKKDIIETVYASGKIISENEYSIYALSNGTVNQKLVKEGDTVSKDKILYIIRNDASTARLEATRASYENAKANASPQSRILNDLKFSLQNSQVKFSNDSLQYFRMKNLLEQNATSKVNVDNAFTNYTVSLNQKKSAEEKFYSAMNDLKVALENSKSQLAVAQSELDNYYVKSNASGMVFQTLKEPGEAVRAGEIVALLGDATERIIKLSVDQQDIYKIKNGQEVLLKTDITGNAIYHATVSRIYPVMNEMDQTFRVDVVFKDSMQFGSGGFIHSSVEANIIIQQKNNALVIPHNAIVADDSVKVNADRKTKTIAVKTGIRTLDDVEIISGLDETSEIIIPSQK